MQWEVSVTCGGYGSLPCFAGANGAALAPPAPSAAPAVANRVAVVPTIAAVRMTVRLVAPCSFSGLIKCCPFDATTHYLVSWQAWIRGRRCGRSRSSLSVPALRRTGSGRSARGRGRHRLSPGELADRVQAGTLQQLPGIGEVTAQVIAQAAAGQEPEYLTRLLGGGPPAPPSALRAAMRGDCHAHSDWSDGGSPPLEMALAARDLGHEWMALTDHSPRLTVANGLSADRLRAQLELIGELNETWRRSGSCPGSRSTSSTTAPSTRPTSCSGSSTSWSPACTPSCGCRPRR